MSGRPSRDTRYPLAWFPREQPTAPRRPVMPWRPRDPNVTRQSELNSFLVRTVLGPLEVSARRVPRGRRRAYWRRCAVRHMRRGRLKSGASVRTPGPLLPFSAADNRGDDDEDELWVSRPMQVRPTNLLPRETPPHSLFCLVLLTI